MTTSAAEDLLDAVRIDLREEGGTRSMVECDKARLLGLIERLLLVPSETGATRFNEEQQAMVEDVMLAKTVQHETSPYDTMAALTYLYESTASQGQWANHAVHSFVGAMLRSVAASEIAEPSELQIQAGAVILATTPLIDAPKLDHHAWMGLSRAILEAANAVRR